MKGKDFDLKIETTFLQGCYYRPLGWSLLCLDALKLMLHCLLSSSPEVKEFLYTSWKPYLGWTNNKVLLYSTGNCIQYPVINHNGK